MEKDIAVLKNQTVLWLDLDYIYHLLEHSKTLSAKRLIKQTLKQIEFYFQSNELKPTRVGIFATHPTLVSNEGKKAKLFFDLLGFKTIETPKGAMRDWISQFSNKTPNARLIIYTYPEILKNLATGVCPIKLNHLKYLENETQSKCTISLNKLRMTKSQTEIHKLAKQYQLSDHIYFYAGKAPFKQKVEKQIRNLKPIQPFFCFFDAILHVLERKRLKKHMVGSKINSSPLVFSDLADFLNHPLSKSKSSVIYLDSFFQGHHTYRIMLQDSVFSGVINICASDHQLTYLYHWLFNGTKILVLKDFKLFLEKASLNDELINELNFNTVLDLRLFRLISLGRDKMDDNNRPYFEQTYKALIALSKDDVVRRIYEYIERPFVLSTLKMQQHGVNIDRPCLKRLSHELQLQIDGLRSRINLLSGHNIDLRSHNQLRDLLFEKCKYPQTPKQENGKPSLTEKSLSKIRQSNGDIVDCVIRARKMIQILDTYVNPLLKQSSHQNSRIFTHFDLFGSQTGRIISTLQSIPKKGYGESVRQSFKASPGFKIVSLDYSQIELRILAHFSQDKQLINAFISNEDIHDATARDVFSVAHPQPITIEQRRFAKTINFGLIYGMSSFGLSQKLNCSTYEATRFITKYFTIYKGVKDYIDNSIEQAKQSGVGYTLNGRAIPIKGIQSNKTSVMAQAQRLALSLPIQSSAAEIIKVAMNRIHNHLESLGLSDKVRMVMQIHDELVFEISEPWIDIITPTLTELMETSTVLSVPLEVNIKVSEFLNG